MNQGLHPIINDMIQVINKHLQQSGQQLMIMPIAGKTSPTVSNTPQPQQTQPMVQQPMVQQPQQQMQYQMPSVSIQQLMPQFQGQMPQMQVEQPVAATHQKKPRILEEGEKQLILMAFLQNPKLTFTELKQMYPQLKLNNITLKEVKAQFERNKMDYKIIDSGDDQFYNHFSFSRGVSQTPYMFEHLKTFSQMLFFSITSVLSKNPKYALDIDIPRQNGDMDVQIIKQVIFELTEQISDATGDAQNDVNLWEYFKLFLYPEYAFSCDTTSQRNIIYKFIAIAIRLMIKNYKFDEYVSYQSVFIRKINATFQDFTEAINNLTTDQQQLGYFQTMMQKALPKFQQWYKLRELTWKESDNQKQQIQQQLYSAGI